MLIQFNFNNYKSFRDETILDLSASKEKEFSDRIVSIGNEKILPAAVVYGPNASGKSNVLSAFNYMTNYVLESFAFGDDKNSSYTRRPYPFMFDNTSGKSDSTFEVYFTVPRDRFERVYNYGFCIGVKGIREEWLNYKAKTARNYKRVFYRDANSIDFYSIPEKSRENIKTALDDQVLIISLGAKLKVEKCKVVRDWFLNNIFVDFGDSAGNLAMNRTLPDGFVSDEETRDDIVNYFSSFDDSIKGFKVIKAQGFNNIGAEQYYVQTLHKKIGSSDMARLPLEQESAGTLKMLRLYQNLKDTLLNGGVLVADELNANLHPLLVRNLIIAFLNPEVNTNHAQLIFTTHDTWQLSNNLFRRDEIWFTDKNDQGISTLYSLSDFTDEDGNRVRKDESYEKNYLLGKYGAIPTLKSIRIPKES